MDNPAEVNRLLSNEKENFKLLAEKVEYNILFDAAFIVI